MSSSSSTHQTYNRKQKSLGLLCTNFLSFYNKPDVHLIGLDDAASRLGVERRRIYDIVNILESVGVLARKAKNQYAWKGFAAIPAALQELKDEGLRENHSAFDDAKVIEYDEDDEETLSNPSTGSQNDKSNPYSTDLAMPLKSETCRREKSLALLTQNFVKLFLCSNIETISLDEVSNFLIGNSSSATMTRTKVRRLYDIANVLSSLNLIEKTHTNSRKPAFRWLGLKEKTRFESVGCAQNSNINESSKRAFGNDITNTSVKRSKVDMFMTGDSKMQNQQENHCLPAQPQTDSLTPKAKQNSSSFQFGPFAPAYVTNVVASENISVKRVHDWDCLATLHRPQYQNQALRDLFSHFTEAWKSWYSESLGGG